jgi:DNA-directed RNA polymerase subunit E'/Rpb7
MESTKVNKPRNPQYRQKEIRTVYSLSQITKKIALPINAIGRSIQQTIEETIASMVEGRCIVEGYVKPQSVRVITYSSGILHGDNVVFEVVFECQVCSLVEGTKLKVVAKNITKAGIRAESADEIPSPFVLFVARDHYYSSDYFNSIEEGEKFTARVIAQRFELNDKYVSIIAEIVPPKKKEYQQKPRLEFEDM